MGFCVTCDGSLGGPFGPACSCEDTAPLFEFKIPLLSNEQIVLFNVTCALDRHASTSAEQREKTKEIELYVINSDYVLEQARWAVENGLHIERLRKEIASDLKTICGAQEWYIKDGTNEIIIMATCELGKGHPGRHLETRNGSVWADWSGPVMKGPTTSV